MSFAKPQRLSPLTAQDDFLSDVLKGLSADAKSLPSKYLYDARGSALFEQICATPEYYLTRSELAIMRDSAAEIAQALGKDIRLVELGNGSGLKTRLLLTALERPAEYVPVEISTSALAASSSELKREFPWLEIQPLAADFTAPFTLPKARRTPSRTVVFLAGSTLGNFPEATAITLLRQMRQTAGTGGALLLGLDLKKAPQLIHAAYNDSAGITAQFTLNLLLRMNRELGADFQLHRFYHRARYQVAAGRVETDIVSRVPQSIHIAGRSLAFAADEAIRVEVSCKYDDADILGLATAAGLRIDRQWTDAAGYFAVVLLAPIE